MSDYSFLSPAMKTRIKLFKSLEQLLSEKTLDDISVRELCARADVSKSTFYSYFEDKYEVAQWYSILAHEVGVGQIGRTLTWREGHLRTTRALMQKISMLNKASHSSDVNSINPAMQRWREQRLQETVTAYKKAELSTKLRYQISAVAASETKVCAEFFNGTSNRCSVEEFVDILVSIVPRDLFELLNSPVSPNQFDEETRDSRLGILILQDSLF